MWRTPHAKIYTTDQVTLGVDALIDDFNAKFLYGDNNKLYARMAHPSIVTDSNSKLGDPRYRDTVKNFTQIVGPIVCQTKWDGNSYDHFKANNGDVHGLTVLRHRAARHLCATFRQHFGEPSVGQWYARLLAGDEFAYFGADRR